MEEYNYFNDEKAQKIKSIIVNASIDAELGLMLFGHAITNQSIEMRIEKNTAGLHVPIIKDINTGIEKTGQACPGNPNDYNYDHFTGIWSLK